MKGFPILVILVSALVAYWAYLRPTESQLGYVRTRLSVAQGEYATIVGRTVIEPRLRREHDQIAKRLGGLKAQTTSQAETAFLADAAVLARRTGTRITQIVSKGATLPLALATLEPVRAASLVASSPGVVPSAQPSAAAQLPLPTSDVRGLRLPRTITVEGSFASLLHFADGLGNLGPLVRVNDFGLAQTDKLRAVINIDIVVLDPTQVQEALL